MTSCTLYQRISHILLISPIICPFFSLSVFCQIFLRNYLTYNSEFWYKAWQVVLYIRESATYCSSVPLFVYFSFFPSKDFSGTTWLTILIKLCIRESATYCLLVSLFDHFSFSCTYCLTVLLFEHFSFLPMVTTRGMWVLLTFCSIVIKTSNYFKSICHHACFLCFYVHFSFSCTYCLSVL